MIYYKSEDKCEKRSTFYESEMCGMSKKSAKIAVTYFATIIISLLVIGGSGYFVITSYLNSDKDRSIKPADIVETTAPTGEFVPSASDSQTVLFILETEKQRMDAVCFVLARLVPEENKVVIVPLQSDICAELDGSSNTLYEFYRLGGTSDAVRAVEKAVGVRADKYMKFKNESFAVFANFMGNVMYTVPYNLVYNNESTGESTVMRSGEQMLDSESLRKIMTYPDFKGGEEYRATVVGTLAVDLVNSGAKGILHDGMDTVFTDIINSDVETDITRYDYEDKKPALDHVLDNNDSPAQLVLPSGVYNENGQYVLDDSFIQALQVWFVME